MKDAVIVDGVRTPVGNHGGALRTLLAKDLLALVFKAIVERNHLDPALIDEVIAGCIAQPSDAPNIARVSALMAGIPKETPALTVARNCNSGLDAIVEAWRRIQLDEGHIYLVGGVESLLTYPIAQTHQATPPALLARVGLDDRLLRLSVGIEDPDDLIADLAQALS